MGEVDNYRLGHTFIQIYRSPAIKKVKKFSTSFSFVLRVLMHIE
jgi:hypothetical protein